MADLHTMYRVMILYMLNQVEYPLTNTQITNLFWKKNIRIILRFRRFCLT